ncbi:unnamed protein product [Gongylonema pulchrum]|uniref:Transcription initiation factor IIF subunit alpha n=1 Tax=Gongylonema pulchrum TaxID=637853 RepID=A0A183ELL9_9BILA|nr:unnamed protein product [Gongylonema pulchrum]
MKRKVQHEDEGLSEIDIKIPHLKKIRRYKEQKPEGSSVQDDYVLSKLLRNAGVISALQHDQIFSGSIADDQLIEDEANAVAAEAAASLRRSRFMSTAATEKPKFGLRKAAAFQRFMENDDSRDEANADEPTFSGAALLRENKSDTSLLDAIRRRKQRTFDTWKLNEERVEEDYPSLHNVSTQKSSKKLNKYEKLAEEIRSFFAIRNGTASTEEILQNFKNRVPVEDSYQFRSILRRLCKLQKDTSIWFLRDEFQ